MIDVATSRGDVVSWHTALSCVLSQGKATRASLDGPHNDEENMHQEISKGKRVPR